MPKIDLYDPWNPVDPYDKDLRYQPWDGAGPVAELLWTEHFDRMAIAEGWAMSMHGFTVREGNTYGAEIMGPSWYRGFPVDGVFEGAQDMFEFILGRAIDGSAMHLLACKLLGVLPGEFDA